MTEDEFLDAVDRVMDAFGVEEASMMRRELDEAQRN